MVFVGRVSSTGVGVELLREFSRTVEKLDDVAVVRDGDDERVDA